MCMCVIFLWINKWVSEIANGPIVLCRPNSGGYFRRNRTSPRCLLCICAVCLVNRESRSSSSEIHSYAVIGVVI